jgi:hypothetical protein
MQFKLKYYCIFRDIPCCHNFQLIFQIVIFGIAIPFHGNAPTDRQINSYGFFLHFPRPIIWQRPKFLRKPFRRKAERVIKVQVGQLGNDRNNPMRLNFEKHSFSVHYQSGPSEKLSSLFRHFQITLGAMFTHASFVLKNIFIHEVAHSFEK